MALAIERSMQQSNEIIPGVPGDDAALNEAIMASMQPMNGMS